MGRYEADHILFGAAYYDEYLMMKGIDRIDEDMAMMKAAGLNVIRIAESTWSTCEPQPDVFDLTYVDRALDAAQRAGIDVIVGTPTYAVPSWLVKLDPSVLAVTPNGQGKYGARQIMDIVNATYRFYGERVIRKLISHVADHPAVIGYQVDNETKYYDSVSEDMQRLFVKYLREKFHGDLDELNHHFGLDYWSNRIDSWEDFPDVTATINESLGGEFDKFRRDQVRAFLQWQADIVREYAHDDQFITHNFDFEWRGYSYGVQPAVDHFKASTAVDITGVDIYHPTEDDLTGKEIAFGGDMTRSTKDGRNYLVLETEAQGQHGWVPFPGQLRLQAYSHLASGADMVEYWHWHSIHNSFETYWKGLLSHDLEPNPTYREAGVFGREIAKLEVGERLVHLIADYAGYSGEEVIVVFDGHYTDRPTRSRTMMHGVEVVFTKHAESADNYIEAACDAAPKWRRVRVATSDAVEQTVTLGRGAERISSREFLIEITQTRQTGRVRMREEKVSRGDIFSRLPPHQREIFERMRRGEE